MGELIAQAVPGDKAPVVDLSAARRDRDNPTKGSPQ
jgi:hypothetical protein